MNPYISIIIPVYNTANYVARTLNSIIQQNFDGYEIILIDDGSRDNSNNICKQYAATYPHIIFIEKENEGVAITRNKALNIAHGEYIFFIDSDDIVYPESFGKVVSILTNTQPDFLRYDFNTIDIHDANLYPNHLRKKRKKYHCMVLNAADFMQKVIKNEYYLCMHVFRRDIIDKNNIRFLDGCTYNEDTLFIIQYLQHCSKCIYADILFYGYRKCDEAVTAHFTEKHYNDVKRVYWALSKLATDNNKIQMGKNIQRVAGELALHLHKHVSAKQHIDKEYQDIENDCKQKALSIEWNFKQWLPENLCNIAWELINLIKKIANRL